LEQHSGRKKHKKQERAYVFHIISLSQLIFFYHKKNFNTRGRLPPSCFTTVCPCTPRHSWKHIQPVRPNPLIYEAVVLLIFTTHHQF